MTEAASLKSQVLRAVAWASAARITGQSLNWAMTLVVIRFLQPADYGLMAITMAVTGFLTAMSYVGFSDVLVQSRATADDGAGEVFSIIIVANLVFLAVLLAAAPMIAEFYHDPRLIPLLRTASLTFVLLTVASLPRATLLRALALKQMSMIDMTANVTGGAVTILLATRGFGVWSLLSGYLLAETVRTTGFLVLAPHRQWPALPSRRHAGMFRDGLYRTAENLLWYFGTQIDIFITGRMLGSGALGIYSLSRTLASLPLDKLVMVIKPIGLPVFARLQDDSAQALGYLGKSMRVIAVVSFPTFIGMSAVAPDFVRTVLGPSWAGAGTPLAILALGMTLRPAGLFISPFLLGMGKFRASLVNTVAFVCLFGTAFGIGAHWGLDGVCIGAAVAYPLQFLFMVRRIAVVRSGYFLLLLKPLLGPVLAAATMYLCVRAVAWYLPADLTSYVRLFALVGAGAGVYALAALLLCREIVWEIVALTGLDQILRQRLSPARAGSP